MRKVFVLLLASLVVMLAMSLMFTSVVSAANANETSDAAYINAIDIKNME